MGTSISPWVVTMEALKPFAVDNYKQDPAPFQYLQHNDKYTFDVKLNVSIQPEGGQPSTGTHYTKSCMITVLISKKDNLFLEKKK